MTYSGSCHCGVVTFEVDGEIPDSAIDCNCSHCRRKGFLLTFVPTANFRLTAGEGSLTEYRFNKHVIAHRFCSTCGCQPFSMSQKADGTPTVGVNLRCVPDADLGVLKIVEFDGASL